MKKILLLNLLILYAAHIYGWGQTGHRAIGLIAEKHLSKKSRKAVERILGGESLAMSSTWMDEIRSDSLYDYTADWHWVTIPDEMTYEQSEKNPKGDVIEAIERIVAELKSKQLSPIEEANKLKMLIHLVGDIHQPLHVGRGTDRGGNTVKVMWFKADSNLHRVWDSDMIDDKALSYSELAAWIQYPNKNEVLRLQKTNVREWADESMRYRNQVYKYGNGKIGYEYSYKNFNIVKTRLQQSGIRLAGLLNEIYG